MTKEEYTNAIQAAQREHTNAVQAAERELNQKKLQLAKEYVLANKSYNIGDIIEGPVGIMCIERIKINMIMLDEYPSCSYYGTMLTKKLEPMKRQPHRPIGICDNYVRRLVKKADVQ